MEAFESLFASLPPPSQPGPVLQLESDCSLQGGDGLPFLPEALKKARPECFLVCLYSEDLKFPDSIMTRKEKIKIAVTHQLYAISKSFNHPDFICWMGRRMGSPLPSRAVCHFEAFTTLGVNDVLSPHCDINSCFD